MPSCFSVFAQDRYRCMLRPHVSEFLNKMYDAGFEMILFTSGGIDYCRHVRMILNKACGRDAIQFCCAREQCFWRRNNGRTKVLLFILCWSLFIPLLLLPSAFSSSSMCLSLSMRSSHFFFVVFRTYAFLVVTWRKSSSLMMILNTCAGIVVSPSFFFYLLLVFLRFLAFFFLPLCGLVIFFYLLVVFLLSVLF